MMLSVVGPDRRLSDPTPQRRGLLKGVVDKLPWQRLAAAARVSDNVMRGSLLAPKADLTARPAHMSALSKAGQRIYECTPGHVSSPKKTARRDRAAEGLRGAPLNQLECAGDVKPGDDDWPLRFPLFGR